MPARGIVLVVLAAAAFPADAGAQLPRVSLPFGLPVSASPTGDVLSVTEENLAARFASPGASLGPAVPVAGPDTRSGYSTVAEMGPSGQALVVWSPGGPEEGLLAAFRAPGGVFGPSEVLSDDQPGGEQTVALAFDAAGSVTAAWSRGNDKGLAVRTRSPDGGWGPPELISARSAYSPNLVVAADGTATLSYRFSLDRLSRDNRVAVATRPAGGRFGAPQVVARRDVPGSAVMTGNDRGDAAVVWNDRNPKDDVGGLRAAFRTAYGAFTAPVKITDAPAGSPLTSTGPDGRTVIAYTVDGRRLLQRVRTPQGRLLPPRTLARTRIDTTAAPLSLGEGVVAWWDRRSRKELYDLHLATLTGNGTVARSEVIESTGRYVDEPPALFGTRDGLLVVGPTGRITRRALPTAPGDGP